MSRSFQEWLKELPPLDSKEISDGLPQFNQINYLWITNIINSPPNDQIPTVNEMLEWIISGQIDCIRK